VAKVGLYAALAVAVLVILGDVDEERALLALGVPFALLVAGLGCRKAAAEAPRAALWLEGLATVYLVLSGIGTGFAGKWAWTLVLGASAAWMVRAGRELEESSGNLLLYFGALAGTLAFLGPAVLWVPQPVPVAAGVLGRAAALGAVVSALFGSFWGWVLLLALGLLGSALLGRTGAWLAPVSLVALAVFGAWVLPQRAEVVAELLEAGAWRGAGTLLRCSAALHGSMGYGLIALGFAADWLLLPAWKASLLQSQFVRQLLSARERYGTTLAMLLARRREVTPAQSLSVLLFGVVLAFLPVCLWIVVRGLAGEAGTAFAALGIPDVTVPHFRPVWHPSYFVVAAAATLGGWLLLRSHPGLGLPGLRPGAGLYVFSFAVLALFVPSGVTLCFLGQTLARFLFLPAVAPDETPEPAVRAAEEEPRPAPPRAAAPESRPEPRLEQPPSTVPDTRPESRPEPPPAPPEPRPEFQSAQPPPSSPAPDPYATEVLEASGREQAPEEGLIVRHAGPIADAFIPEPGTVCLLSGRELCLYTGGALSGRRVLAELEEPAGLAEWEEGLLAVDKKGRLALVMETGVEWHGLGGGGVGCFAINPFGTVLVFAPPGEGRLFRFLLPARSETFLLDLEAEITCLAFSPDGRLLGAGLADGRVAAVDMARQAVATVSGSPRERGRALFLYPAPAGGWVVAHPGGVLRLLEASGRSKERVGISGEITALCASAEAVAVGTGDGRVEIRSANLRTVSWEGRLHGAAVVRVFAGENSEFFSAAKDGTVKKVPFPER
jgi:hypothetical protein